MSFTPMFEISSISRDSSAITVKDVTTTGGTIGYGSTNAPANIAAITSLVFFTEAYNGSRVFGTINSSYSVSSLSTGLKFNIAVPDGVLISSLLYGTLKTLSITSISSDRITLTITNASSLLARVTFLSINGLDPVEIASISGTTVLLKTALPGTATTLSSLYCYYTAEVRSLVMYKANRCIIRELEKISKCEGVQDLSKAMTKVILKQSAETAYLVGNYAKAHEATLLICGNQVNYTQNCSTCV